MRMLLAFTLLDVPMFDAVANALQAAITATVALLQQNIYDPAGVTVVDALQVMNGTDYGGGDPPNNVVAVCDYTGACYYDDEQAAYVVNLTEYNIHLLPPHGRNFLSTHLSHLAFVSLGFS